MALVSTFLRTGEADLNIVAAVKYSVASERGKEIVDVATWCGHIHQWQVQLMEPAKQTSFGPSKMIPAGPCRGTDSLVLGPPGGIGMRMQGRKEGGRKTTKQEILN
jgi:hypothetical protein